MQLEFDKQKELLIIKDDVPLHSRLVLILLSVNVVNMSFQLVSISYSKNEILFIFMLLLAVISVVAILFYLFKRSWKTAYKLSKIEGFEIKNTFGRERFFLKLINGKKRSFPILKNENEFNSLKNTLTTIGIKSI